jgi:hypothetical protein
VIASEASDTFDVSRSMVRGVAGVVTDGGFRDTPTIAKLAIPTYNNRPSAPTNPTLHQALDIDMPTNCGDVPIVLGVSRSAMLRASWCCQPIWRKKLPTRPWR